jgi:hypothetical protein|tara:strand:- start:128 stop:469 length:342 start_codon:yes stop_codon:yes gene_type:complete
MLACALSGLFCRRWLFRDVARVGPWYPASGDGSVADNDAADDAGDGSVAEDDILNLPLFTRRGGLTAFLLKASQHHKAKASLEASIHAHLLQLLILLQGIGLERGGNLFFFFF